MKSPDQIMHSFRLHTLNNRSGCIGCAYRDPNKVSFKCQHELFKDVREYIKQLKAERDAAVEMLKEEVGCKSCAKYTFTEEYVSNDCLDCVNKCNFEWCGIQKED